MACPTIEHGKPICENGRCGLECVSRSRLCNGVCLAPADDNCCLPGDCPDNGVVRATCVANRCGRECRPNYIQCEGACITEGQPNCCTADRDVDADSNGTADCQESLFGNGQFKTSVGGWYGSPLGSGAIDWVSMDGRERAGSGALRVTNQHATELATFGAQSIFFSLQPGVSYPFSVDYYIPPGQAARGSATMSFGPGFSRTLGNVIGRWTTVRFNVVPASDLSEGVRLDATRDQGIDPFVVYFDNAILRR